MTVDEALVRAEQFKDSKSRLDSVPLTNLESDYLYLAAEVRRLKAMLDVAHMVLTTATVYTPPELVQAATAALRKAGEIP